MDLQWVLLYSMTETLQLFDPTKENQLQNVQLFICIQLKAFNQTYFTAWQKRTIIWSNKRKWITDCPTIFMQLNTSLLFHIKIQMFF
jgi:hypothetical protein